MYQKSRFAMLLTAALQHGVNLLSAAPFYQSPLHCCEGAYMKKEKTMTAKTRGMFALMCVLGVSSLAPSFAGDKQLMPPMATKEEAQIVHWRMPEIEKRFMDIPELPSPYIAVSPVVLDDNLPVSTLAKAGTNTKEIVTLAEEISTGKYGKYDSMLIAQNGKLVFESYFKRGRVDLSHPQSSATKSYTSLALGRAIQMGYLSMDDLDKPVLSFLGKVDRSKLVDGAEKITLRHALTMTTGILISEDGWEAMEQDTARIQGQGHIQAILEDSAPITDESQTFKYGTGPQFVMQVIEAVVPGSAKTFIDKELFGKLGITNYHWRTAPSGLPESGWKVSVTARDMLKLGLLVSNNGKWNNQQLISPEYLDEATQRQIITGDDDIYGGGELVSHQGYGFFWWGTDIEHNGKKHYAFSAQGGGGMYILLVPDFDLVVVVTAHERDDITQQLVAERILPLVARG